MGILTKSGMTYFYRMFKDFEIMTISEKEKKKYAKNPVDDLVTNGLNQYVPLTEKSLTGYINYLQHGFEVG
jgi:hypothetical protein